MSAYPLPVLSTTLRRNQTAWFGVWGLGFGGWGLGFGVWGLVVGVWVLGFGFCLLHCTHCRTNCDSLQVRVVQIGGVHTVCIFAAVSARTALARTCCHFISAPTVQPQSHFHPPQPPTLLVPPPPTAPPPISFLLHCPHPRLPGLFAPCGLGTDKGRGDRAAAMRRDPSEAGSPASAGSVDVRARLACLCVRYYYCILASGYTAR